MILIKKAGLSIKDETASSLNPTVSEEKRTFSFIYFY